MERPSVRVAVVMERRVLANRWQSETWAPVALIPDMETGDRTPRLLGENGDRTQWLHPGFEIRLYRDEAEGYYLNMSAATPFVFVVWREEEGRVAPHAVTVSYNEAARMMDGSERVDGVPMPEALAPWVAAFAAEHYKPEPKKRSRPPSFKGARRDG
ncbi:MAG: DUF3305 domain-containing protein [Burkholderiales bacterium]|nr:DUF3305 domain-containing protein [Burkholderiales bacterium]